MNHTFLRKIISATTMFLMLFSLSAPGLETVYAATLTSVSDTQSTVKAATASNHTISFVTPTGITAGQTILVTFPAGYSLSNAFDFNDADLKDNGSNLTLGNTASGATWGVATTTTTITFTSGTGTVTAGHTITILLGTNAASGATGTHQITNPSAGSYTITIGGTMADSGSVTQNIIANDTVAVTATVSQSISFALVSATGTAFGSAAIYFGTLSSGSAKYASSTNSSGDAAATVGHQLTVSTNAPGGYTVTVLGDTLRNNASSTATITAIGGTPASSSAGSSQFGINVTSSGGTGASIATPYATASQYGFNASTSTAATLASGSQPTNTTTYSLTYLANIPATQAAGTYSTSLTYVGTANF